MEFEPVRPISFVCVRFSDELQQNLLKSDCVHDPRNELIVVDNRQNLFFQSLGAAFNDGIGKATHELIALIHEDVLLPRNWQAQLELSLAELEAHDPDWGMVGAVGWGEHGNSAIGHYSDPHRPIPVNTFKTRRFEKVHRLDEQLMIVRRSLKIRLDPDLPSIHNIGQDVQRHLVGRGLRTFVVDAPTIHKYADADGTLIQDAASSPKIQDRRSLTYLADKAVCDEYLRHKWSRGEPEILPEPALAQQREILDRPLILLGRGGGGTRLASVMAQDCGFFLGNSVNNSGDCLDLVPAVYRCVMRRHNNSNEWLHSRCVPDLRRSAAAMLDKAGWPEAWGFKIPECLLVLPDIRAAFPNARYLYLDRDIEGTILRSTHMTARLDNHNGSTALRAAYDYFGRKRAAVLSDSPLMRMAMTTVHQKRLVAAHSRRLEPASWQVVEFSRLLADPAAVLRTFADYAGRPIVSDKLARSIDRARADYRMHPYSPEEVREAMDFLRRHGVRTSTG